MIAEKPSWVRHEGMQLFSIDIQPGGLRFATGGGDFKVRIWNMKSLGRELERDESTSKLVATLRDHFGSVNCVRWAKHGRFLASGSDDQAILIHERKPGSGTTEFGSGEPPDVENWKVVMTLRGHTADVVDLNWSPDDSTLASGSLDNTVHIWDMNTGSCIRVLRGHTSLVKGVAWDPIGSFVASQSDDKTVIIWRTSDWSLDHKTDGHWSKSLGSTFFRRLDWSPCGHFITTTNGFQKPRHSAPVLERGEWSATFDFLGHNAPIIVVKFNHTLFRKYHSEVETGSKDDLNLQPYNVIAIGSQDRTITVWTTASARPLFVAKHFFSQSVVDLTWSPDGYSLFACSLDGTVAVFYFDVDELGFRLTDEESDKLKRNRYGDVRGGRQANLAETPAQLLLEAVANKKVFDTKTSLKTVKTDSGNLVTKVANVSTRVSSPVKQREYRRPDGRKRIIPEVVGDDESSPHEFANNNNDINSSGLREAFLRKSLLKERCSGVSVSTKATYSETLTIEKATTDQGLISIKVFDKDIVGPVCLEARPREHTVNDIVGIGSTLMKETEIVCVKGTQIIWSDRVSRKVTVLAGNVNFWVVGCEDGSVQVYTKCGRRAFPTMMVGSTPVFIDCDESWKLMTVTKNGSLYMWDLFTRKCLVHDSLTSLVTNTDTIKIISAKLSKCGFPLVTLTTRHAYLFDMSLMCWLRVADDCFPASNYSSSWNLGSVHGGELAGLQVDVRKFLARKLSCSTDDGVQTRAHLESQLASAFALNSANEYRQSLLSYIRFLTREADESRLREVCETFLGPPTNSTSESAWDPFVLGMRKHKLLREDILPAMASNRKVQRLLNEFMDLLSEYNVCERVHIQDTPLGGIMPEPMNLDPPKV